MAEWATFAGVAGVVLALLLALAHLTQRSLGVDDPPGELDGSNPPGHTRPEPGEADRAPAPGDGERVGDPGRTDWVRASEESRQEAAQGDRPESDQNSPEGAGTLKSARAHRTGLESLSTGELLLNVALSQGLFLGVLLAAVWYTQVPLVALGVAPAGGSVPGLGLSSLGLGQTALAAGVALGGLLYVATEVGSSLGDRIGLGSSDALREALAPDTAGGWAVLLGVVLPVIAGFEELLFRGVLVGGLSVAGAEAGLTVSPWVLAVGSSVLFAVGHGAQGRGGIAVTGLLGLVLAGAFVLTWSLPVVFVAHYLVNALEFVVHEGLGIDWI